MTQNELRLAKLNNVLDELYADETNRLVRARYTLSQEFAILRQRDTKPEEFAAYNTFVEECKIAAKKEIYGEEGQQ